MMTKKKESERMRVAAADSERHDSIDDAFAKIIHLQHERLRALADSVDWSRIPDDDKMRAWQLEDVVEGFTERLALECEQLDERFL